MTPVLEPRFFSFEDDSLDYCGPGDHLLKERVVTRLDDYAALFRDVTDELAIGEVSPAYLSSEYAPLRIRHYIPQAKIIAILRNPVERAISSFRLERLDGFETEADLTVALGLEEVRMRANWSYVWRYKSRGFYFTHLSRYFKLFSRDQIKVLLYEEWQGDNGTALLKKVFRFLGVDDAAGIPEQAVHVNSTRVDRFTAKGLERFEPSAELEELLAELYREEIDKLEELINLDLSIWRRGTA